MAAAVNVVVAGDPAVEDGSFVADDGLTVSKVQLAVEPGDLGV